MWNLLKLADQLLQQWLHMSGKTSLVVVQSLEAGYLTQLVFCFCWTPKNVGSNASEGVDVLARHGQAG